MESVYFLQHYWWAVVSLLGALLVFLLFVQGLQGLLLWGTRTSDEKDLVVRYAGLKWEITFTTLVTFGGAAFASFPLFYAVSFGGAYWLWIAILLSFVLQAISFEFRKDAGNLFGQHTYEVLLFLNGILGSFLLGVAVSMFFTGAPFTVDRLAIGGTSGSNIVSRWQNSWHGLDAFAHPASLLLGLTVLTAAFTQGLLFLLTKPDVDGDFASRCRRQLKVTAPLFLLSFIIFVLWLFLKSGYSVDPVTGDISEEPYKYLHNMLEQCWIGIIFLLGVLLVLAGLIRNFMDKGQKVNFYVTGLGIVLAVWALLLCAGFNGTAYFVSTVSPEVSLTLYNSSSSPFTLKVMAYASLAVPVVAVYIGWVWRKLR